MEMTEKRKAEIARRLAEARADLGLTQIELAKACGIYHSTISRYETGERVPTPRYMRKLADKLNKSIPYLRATDYQNGEEGTDGTG
jgi:transcriptional regulator with XRE-family HTH domain